MLRRGLALWFAFLFIATAAYAERRVDPLADVLQLGDVIAVMRAEGLDYAREIEAELFAGDGGTGWAALSEQLYDAARLETIVRDRLDAELADTDLQPVIAFFSTDTGRQITELEIAARRALMDEGVEEKAQAAAADLPNRDAARHQLLTRFIDANNLIDANVAGAMNASHAFYTGLASGEGIGDGLTQEQIIADVWAQEDAIRADTELWLMRFLHLAYRPLADEDITSYIDFSETAAGRALNRALFAAFDEMYSGISHGLGQGAARAMMSQDL